MNLSRDRQKEADSKKNEERMHEQMAMNRVFRNICGKLSRLVSVNSLM